MAARSFINEVAHTKINNIAELQNFFQHLTSNLFKILIFTVPISHLGKRHGQVAVANESKFHDQSFAQAKYDE